MSSREIRRLPNSAPSTKGRTVYGYAAKFNTVSKNLGGSSPWYEEILPGAFPDLSRQDCRAFFNHDRNHVLARSKQGRGTLKLSVDRVGLRYEFEAPDTTTANDMLESIRRGDIDGASFAFSVLKDDWITRDGKRIRQIQKIARLHDVSIVTEGAYSEATAAARSAANKSRPITDEVADWKARFGFN